MEDLQHDSQHWSLPLLPLLRTPALTTGSPVFLPRPPACSCLAPVMASPFIWNSVCCLDDTSSPGLLSDGTFTPKMPDLPPQFRSQLESSLSPTPQICVPCCNSCLHHTYQLSACCRIYLLMIYLLLWPTSLLVLPNFLSGRETESLLCYSLMNQTRHKRGTQ